ncbi:hypothetical protein NMY22_g19037 [Coprinellus aureogranulatus]|nr:hypothetical protein NMY22_g19037 [Coprinellus aureogranulatus]
MLIWPYSGRSSTPGPARIKIRRNIRLITQQHSLHSPQGFNRIPASSHTLLNLCKLLCVRFPPPRALICTLLYILFFGLGFVRIAPGLRAQALVVVSRTCIFPNLTTPHHVQSPHPQSGSVSALVPGVNTFQNLRYLPLPVPRYEGRVGVGSGTSAVGGPPLIALTQHSPQSELEATQLATELKPTFSTLAAFCITTVAALCVNSNCLSRQNHEFTVYSSSWSCPPTASAAGIGVGSGFGSGGTMLSRTSDTFPPSTRTSVGVGLGSGTSTVIGPPLTADITLAILATVLEATLNTLAVAA